MADEIINEDYLRGYTAGRFAINGYAHARLLQVRLFIDSLIDEHTKPEIMEHIKDYSEENE
jgi:hypothetical protein